MANQLPSLPAIPILMPGISLRSPNNPPPAHDPAVSKVRIDTFIYKYIYVCIYIYIHTYPCIYIIIDSYTWKSVRFFFFFQDDFDRKKHGREEIFAIVGAGLRN